MWFNTIKFMAVQFITQCYQKSQYMYSVILRYYHVPQTQSKNQYILKKEKIVAEE